MRITQDVINECKVEKKNCVAFCGDNCNTNFGDAMRRRKENVFAKMKIIIHADVQDVGCPVHIMHDCIQTAAGTLDYDIEVIVFKIYSYFSIYTVQNEKLKEFCDFVDTEHEVLLSHSKTRWLSLFPYVERILKMFDALKSYFLSIEKPQQVLKFFENLPVKHIYIFCTVSR